MTDPELKERILAFMGANKLTVISTVDTETNKPEAAVIAFAEKDTLELVFGTSNTSRKYKNLNTNPNVSFVIGWTDEFGTIQYEGIANELSGETAHAYGEIMAEKNTE
ncbi:MAG TPA: pyridoxamine 5'-phosphate oxidase family protein, partial [Candidatus Paceibacterota bacterium]|nr:pyridoxamine 5'-phosphate oxidase family protein [Candidatus Paceibacterota bacterium]